MLSTGHQLVTLASGAHSLHSRIYGETMHPVVGPSVEADALYVKQLRLLERLRVHQGGFVIWDVGLGAAANALAVLRATRGTARAIRLVSFDNSIEPLVFALQNAGQLGYFAEYRSRAQHLVPHHRVAFDNQSCAVEWKLELADFPSLLAGPEAGSLPKPDAILFDPFSPAKNPAMWTLPLFRNLFRQLDQGQPCALATYSRSTITRTALLLSGFYVGIGRATGLKEETTVAANSPGLITEPLDHRWLDRVSRSESAEPLYEPVHRKARLSVESWELLRAHPQFG